MWLVGLLSLTLVVLSGHAGPVSAGPSTDVTWTTVAVAAGFQGSWKTNYGPMTIRVVRGSVTGQYDYQGTIGDLRGIVDGHILQGRWSDNKSGKGSFQFVLSPDGRSFRGSWTQDGQNRSGEWYGVR